MGLPASRTVDVREMLCAQALALVAQALAACPPGTPVRAVYSTDDVRRDLAAWAAERGYELREAGGAVEIETR